jgi:hypothetical protein
MPFSKSLVQTLVVDQLNIVLEPRMNNQGLTCVYIYIRNYEHKCAVNILHEYDDYDTNGYVLAHCWSSHNPTYYLYGFRNPFQCAKCLMTTIEALYNDVKSWEVKAP